MPTDMSALIPAESTDMGFTEHLARTKGTQNPTLGAAHSEAWQAVVCSRPW